MLKTIALLVLALGLATHAANAQDRAPDLGPAIGTKAPEIGTPADQFGAPRSMASLMGEKGVVLFFFRSTVW